MGIYSKNKVYYFISMNNMDGKTLSPRVPDNFLTKYGYEDNETKRVCVSTSVGKCLRAMSMNLKDKDIFIHVVDTELTQKDIHIPTIKEVPDCKITGEVWVLKPVKMKCIGMIHVKNATDKSFEYKYGNNKAELYDWDFDWIEKYINEFANLLDW